MVNDIAIREINEDELPQLLDLYKHLHSQDDPLLDDAMIQSAWSSILGNPWMRCLVAEYNGRIVSSCTLIITPNLTRGARPYGLIESVVTHTDYRCKGIGTAVLKYALGIAWDVDCYKVMLLTGRKDQSVFNFYEKAGFRIGIKTGFIAYPDQG
ncbi:MAG: GNAT family N-acetyltransferase [Armatimonadota bacterium]